jgi:hypothetical protein
VCLIICVINKPQRRRPTPDLGCTAIGWTDGGMYGDNVSRKCVANVPAVQFPGDIQGEYFLLDGEEAATRSAAHAAVSRVSGGITVGEGS